VHRIHAPELQPPRIDPRRHARPIRSLPTDRNAPSTSGRRAPASPYRRRREAPCPGRARDSTTSGSRDSSLPGPRLGIFDELPGHLRVAPIPDFRRFRALELFVGREEVLDLTPPVPTELMKPTTLVQPGI